MTCIYGMGTPLLLRPVSFGFSRFISGVRGCVGVEVSCPGQYPKHEHHPVFMPGLLMAVLAPIFSKFYFNGMYTCSGTTLDICAASYLCSLSILKAMTLLSLL